MKPSQTMFSILVLGAAVSLVGETSASPLAGDPSTAEGVLEKAQQATGGKAAFEKLKSLEETGTWSASEGDPLHEVAAFKFTRLLKAPDCIYACNEGPGGYKSEKVCDGKTGWVRDTSGGLKDLGKEDLVESRQGSLAALRDWRICFEKADLVGKEKIGDKECHVVTLTSKSGKPVTRWYDATTFLLLQEEWIEVYESRNLVTHVVSQRKQKVTQTFGDFRREEGLCLPWEARTVTEEVKEQGDDEEMLAKQKSVCLLTTLSRRFNVSIADARFAKPQAPSGKGSGGKGKPESGSKTP